MTKQIQALSFVLFLLGTFLNPNTGLGQSLKQQKMADLSYLVGEWIGTSTQFENGQVSKQVPAFEKIFYDLDGHILVIELNSELLQLHTIIYYSEEDKTYYYNPYSVNGARRLPAMFTDGKFIVKASPSKRFIFEKYKGSGFREYGEELVDGEWVKYFEDIFVDTR
jgi:hypothetical protein